MFEDFAKAVSTRFQELSQGELFVTDAPDLWEAYLAAFPEGTNPMFRKRTEHDCSTCRRFVTYLGNLVDKDRKSVWGGHNLHAPYQAVADKLNDIVVSSKIVSIFRTKEAGYGQAYNFDGDIKWHHFHGRVATKHHAADPAKQIGIAESRHQVLHRGLSTFNLHDFDTVIDLIKNNQIYRGAEHLNAVKAFRDMMLLYDLAMDKEMFAWNLVDNNYATFRNTAIGTLFVDLTEGKDLEDAVKSFESKVAPTNYKRPTAIISQKMVEDAVSTLHKLGLSGAISRRYAKLSDVSVNDVLFVDNTVQLKDNIVQLLKGHTKEKTTVHEPLGISADDFIKKVLPKTKKMSLFLKNNHLGNFISLTGADGPERLFKWDNNFAWSYDGDVADSVKQRVKAAGGKIDCDLRVSLSWFNTDDLDLHALLPNGEEVYFRNKCDILDVDMNAGSNLVTNPVENLAFNRPKDGRYTVWVNQFHRRNNFDVGFNIEVESGGTLKQYSYDKRVEGKVSCFTITVFQGRVISVQAGSSLKEQTLSKEKWGVKTETLVPVSTVLFSPNHWGNQKVGARHLIFNLRDCVNPESCRGFYNEFLRPDLEQHRKVFEILGAKTKCPFTKEQVSGVGFTAGRNDSVTVVVNGFESYTINF